jgi:hypothetical protein
VLASEAFSRDSLHEQTGKIPNPTKAMAISKEIQYASIDQFRLDPENPRLRHLFEDVEPTQSQVMAEMEDWKLDELAISFLSSGGFWVQEAVLVLTETIKGKQWLTVVEGNRRLAALMKLRDLIKGAPTKSSKWRNIVAMASEQPPAPDLFDRIPFLTIEQRSDVDEYLGFRHVTGIEEWNPPEKAAYIAKLIDERGMSYVEVMRKIGSKTSTVRQHYIAYRLFLQMQQAEALPDEGVQNRFSVMYLSLRTPGVQMRLGLDMNADPADAKTPVKPTHEPVLPNFARWIYGDDDNAPVFSDSRQVDLFGRILESDDAFAYLSENKDARFEHARVLAGGDLPETVSNVKKASEHIRLALAQAHLYRDHTELQKAMSEFGADAIQLMSLFREKYPEFRKRFAELIKE